MKFWLYNNEIGTCPNIEVNIEVTDNSPFFKRPYHVKEDDRAVLDKEMRRFMLFRNIEGRVFSLFKSCDADYLENDFR